MELPLARMAVDRQPLPVGRRLDWIAVSGLVLPEFRPTLRDTTAAWPAWRRRAVWVVLAIFLLVPAALLVKRSSPGAGVRVVHPGAVAFNLRYPAVLHAMPRAPGELLHLERRAANGDLIDSYVVQPLHLPAYQGDIGGILPVVAEREVDALRKQFPNLEPVEEGKARINTVAGYTLVFRADRAKRLYGRVVLLPQPVPGARDGVRLVLLASARGGGVGKAADVGTMGQLKTPYRSFRFGTEGP